MTTTTIRRTSPIGEIARFHPATIAVFEAMDIEYACKGGRQLYEAALAAGADPDELLRAAQEVARVAAPTAEGTVAELLHRIITEHHDLELSAVREITTRLARMSDAPLADRIRRLLLVAHDRLSGHILREERELFPRIEELDLHPHRVRAGSISRPLLIEFVEHETVNEYLANGRMLALRLRGSDVDPELLDEVEQLVRRVQRHLHLENNVLIPRVLDLEYRLKAARHAEPAHMH
jgi:regulator of cell morphogenesis and NO signaling